MESEQGWLKKALEDATTRVGDWPEWKRSLQSAMEQNDMPAIESPVVTPMSNSSAPCK
jgi:hypothetical protein